jgi:recombination protein RecA
MQVKHLPTGVESVDNLLGGGIPRGHITEFFGPYSSGKSWLATLALAETQRNGGTAALVDTEISFSVGLARELGVDTSKLLLSTPANGEDALAIILGLIGAGVDLIVLDSATALVPAELLVKPPGRDGYDPTTLLWNSGLKRIKPALAFGTTGFVFVNQVRANMNMQGPFSPTTIEPLGYRSKHDSVLRVSVRRTEWIGRGTDRIGQVARVKVEKAKYDGCSPIGSECTFEILFPKPQVVAGTEASSGTTPGGDESSAIN